MRHEDDLRRWTTEGVWELVAGNREFGVEVLEGLREVLPGKVVKDPRRAPVC
jgi:hypothetical protein